MVTHYYTKDNLKFLGKCINDIIHLQLFKFFHLFMVNLVILLLPIYFTYKKKLRKKDQ